MMKLLKKNKNANDLSILDSHTPRLSFEQRIEVLLWGDDKLGVVGIGSRIVRLEKYVKWGIALSIITALALLEHLTGTNSDSAGIFGKMLINFTNLILGG